jgi:hypothetical protein
MASIPVAPLASLPRLDVLQSEAAHALLRLLAADDVRLAIGDAPELFSHAFIVNDAMAFMLPGLGSDEPDIDALCNALDAADPLLSHIEARLGQALDPTGLLPITQTAFGRENAVVLNVQKGDLSLSLALYPDEAMLAAWRDRADTVAINPANVLVPVTLDCVAARLPVADAAGIAAGDLLLLAKTLQAALMAGNGLNENGLLEFNNGNWRVGAFADAEDDMIDGEDGQAGGSGFTVPVTMRLPQQAVDAATLSALAPGMVIPLSPLVQGLAVDLLVGGRRIARGEIVELGENFAVHIDEAFSSPASAAAQPMPIDEEE